LANEEGLVLEAEQNIGITNFERGQRGSSWSILVSHLCQDRLVGEPVELAAKGKVHFVGKENRAALRAIRPFWNRDVLKKQKGK